MQTTKSTNEQNVEEPKDNQRTRFNVLSNLAFV